MRILLRILVVIPLGFIAAVLAASLTILAAVPGISGPSDAIFDGPSIAFVLLFAAFGGAAAAFPMLPAVVLAEAFRWRSFLFWALVGGAIGLLSGTLLGLGGHVPLFLAAGFIGGAVYWLIAGRSSGLSDAGPRP